MNEPEDKEIEGIVDELESELAEDKMYKLLSLLSKDLPETKTGL